MTAVDPRASDRRPLSYSGGKHSHWSNRAAEIEEAWRFAEHPLVGRRANPAPVKPRATPKWRTRAGRGRAK